MLLKFVACFLFLCMSEGHCYRDDIPGNKTTIDKHRYMVSIHIDDAFIAAGVVIGSFWVLTDSSEFIYFEYTPLDVAVQSGSTWRDGTDGVHCYADQLVVNQTYRMLLIKTTCNLMQGPSVSAVELPPVGEPIPDNTEALIVGWGSFTRTNWGRTQLHALTVVIAGDAACVATFGAAYDAPNQLCVTSYDGCTGVAPMLTGNKVQGFALSNDGCSTSAVQYNAFTCVAKVRPWIKKTTGI